MSLTAPQLCFFAGIIEKELGIIYTPENYFQLEQRIEKIALHLGLPTATDVYSKAIQEGVAGDFKQYLLDTATNNETSFFRDPKVFLAIENTVLPTFRKNAPTSFIYRIWCTAASFGQEPYSIAMLVHEFLLKNPGHPRIEIIATDIADHALKRCREGKYTQLEAQRGLSAARLVQHFKKDEEGFWILNPQIRSMVQFKKQNLLEPFIGMGTFNLILCRYVLIYQNADRKKSIIEKLERCLSSKSHLVLGASESALGCSTTLDQVAIGGAILYQKT